MKPRVLLVRRLQSVQVFYILNHPCLFMVCYLSGVHLSELSFLGFLQFKSNTVTLLTVGAQNNRKYCEAEPGYYVQTFNSQSRVWETFKRGVKEN